MSDAPRGSFWMVVGVFVLIGPFIGGVLVGIVSLVERTGPIDWRDVIALPLVGLTGYLMGLLPAFLTGAISGAVSSRIGSKALWISLATAAGAAFSSLMMPSAWMYFAPIGAGAAFVASLIALQVRPRWRN